jgi:hypothetical protein
LKNINLDELTEYASTISQTDSWSDNIIEQLKTTVFKYLLSLLLLAFILGVLCSLLSSRQKINKFEMFLQRVNKFSGIAFANFFSGMLL